MLVNGIEHSRNDLGINVVVFDPVTLNVEETESFDTGHYPDASIKLTEYIHSLPLMSMVFIVVRGEANFFLTGAIFFILRTINTRANDSWFVTNPKRFSTGFILPCIEHCQQPNPIGNHLGF